MTPEVLEVDDVAANGAYHRTVPDNHPIRVLANASEQQWPLTTSRRGRDWLLTITSPDGTSWAADGPDLFKALRALRRILAGRRS